MKKRLSILLVFLLFVLSAQVSFHRHDDGISHRDCAVCACLDHHTTFIGQESPDLFAAIPGDIPLFSQEDEPLTSFDPAGFFPARAPPA